MGGGSHAKEPIWKSRNHAPCCLIVSCRSGTLLLQQEPSFPIFHFYFHLQKLFYYLHLHLLQPLCRNRFHTILSDIQNGIVKPKHDGISVEIESEKLVESFTNSRIYFSKHFI